MYKSKFTINESPVYISDNMSGKMAGFPSISTSCRLNPICQMRHEQGNSICKHCFAFATTARYKALESHLEENYWLLTGRVLELDELPRFSKAVSMARIESFGDLACKEQAMNYLNIARVNPHVHFAWWTKNPNFIQDALGMDEKPSNVQIVYSSPIVNAEVQMKHILPWMPFVDKIFTVYDKSASEKVKINCGAKSCATCGLCYFNKSVKYIKEVLK